MQAVTLRLRRRWPPGTKSVSVGPITVAGFHTLVYHAGERSMEVRMLAGREITDVDLLRALRADDWALFADLICRDQEPGFFTKWLSLANVEALLRASEKANNWRRIFGCLNLDLKAPPRKGSLMDDVVAVCREIPGQSVNGLLQLPMESFMDMVETLNRDALAMDPTADPDALPSEGIDLAGIPGVTLVH